MQCNYIDVTRSSKSVKFERMRFVRVYQYGTGEESLQYVSWINLMVRYWLVDVGTDGIIVIHVILNKLGMMASSGLMWLTLGISVECL